MCSNTEIICLSPAGPGRCCRKVCCPVGIGVHAGHPTGAQSQHAVGDHPHSDVVLVGAHMRTQWSRGHVCHSDWPPGLQVGADSGGAQDDRRKQTKWNSDCSERAGQALPERFSGRYYFRSVRRKGEWVKKFICSTRDERCGLFLAFYLD